MAHSEKLAERIRAVLEDRDDVVEKKMFGGIAFMVRGNMACGAVRGELMARVGPGHYEWALTRPRVRPMDFTGRPLRGFVYVGTAGIRTRAMLSKWWLSETYSTIAPMPGGSSAPNASTK